MIDLRHLRNFTLSSTTSLTYGEEWDIAIFLMKNVTLSDGTEIAPYILNLPKMFLRKTNEKISAHTFKLFAYSDTYMKVTLRILKPEFAPHRSVFLQTASFSLQSPNRAILGKQKTFAFVLLNNGIANLPVSLPDMIDQKYPDVITTYTRVDNTQTAFSPLNISSVESILAYQVNNDKYWKNQVQLAVPFIPFMSNCKNQGQFIYLHDIIENPSSCQLYSAEDTIPVPQLGFMQQPTSDNCPGIQFTCIMEEAFFTSASLTTYYQQKVGTSIFFITADPLNFYDDIVKRQMTFDPSNLIPVVTSNEVPSTQLPKQINLHIEYQQVDKTTKRIIKAYMIFSQLIYKSNIPANDSTFQYEFILTFHPQDHAELAINFALDIPVYVILSTIIGLFSIAMIFFYFIFYRVANWVTRRKIGTQQDSNPLNIRILHIKGALTELKQFMVPYVPIVKGIVFGYVPTFILLLLLSLAMVGGFWGFGFFECIEITTDGICESSFIEKLGGNSITTAKRRGRLGLALIIVGLYGIIRTSAIFIPSSQKDLLRENVQKFEKNEKNSILPALQQLEEKVKFLVTESYDGNIWHDKIWHRGLFISMALLVIALMIFVIFLSFSAYYGEHAWGFLFALKILQIFTEEMLKFSLEDELLLSALSCFITISLSVSGLGATDFFAFLFNTFISLGISCFEKTNQVLAVDFISDHILEFIQILNTWIVKTFSFSSQEEEQEKLEQELQMQQNQNGQMKEDEANNNVYDEDANEFSANQKGEIGNSSIFLTDHFEDSFDQSDFGFKNDLEEIDKQQNGAHKKIGSKKLKSEKSIVKIGSPQLKKSIGTPLPQEQISNNTEESDINSSIDPFEDRFKELINQKFSKSATGVWQRQQTRGKTSAATAAQTLLDVFQDSINRQLKICGDFSNNTFSLISTPGQVLALWMFYDANQMFVKWGITKKGLVFYYLFNILNIPFQIVMDILFLKTVEELHDISTLDYQRMVQDKFKERGLHWKVDEEDSEEEVKYIELLDPDLRHLHRWCFSSQLFFCLSIFIGGSIGVLEGVIMCLLNAYNVFADAESFLILLIVWLPICFFFDFVCVKFIGPLIWSANPKSQMENEPSDEIIDSLELKNNKNSNIGLTTSIKLKEKIILVDDEGNISPILQKHKPKSNNNNNGQLFPLPSPDNLLMLKQEGFYDPESGQASFLFSGGISSSRIGVNPLVGLNASEFIEMDSPIDNQKILAARKKSRFVPPETVETALDRALQLESLTSPQSKLININGNIQNQNNLKVNETYHSKKNIESQKEIAIIEESIEENEEYGQQKDDYVDELTKEINQNRFLKSFIQQQIESVFDYDISVHNFILEFVNQQHLSLTKREKILEVIRSNYEKQKIGKAVTADQQYEKLFKISFQKAILEKEKKSKYQDIKSHFQENEYHDDKFLNNFLKANKQWLRRNTKIFFEEVLTGGGESHHKREKYKKLILLEFKQIYGDFSIDNNIVSAEIADKNASNKLQPLKSEVQSLAGSPVHLILRYWKQRAELLRTTTTTVGRLFFQNNLQHCSYCHSNWGLSLNTQKNIEDLFLAFYKIISKKLGFNFNVVQLFDQGYLLYQKIQGTTKNISQRHMHEQSQSDWDDYGNFMIHSQRESLDEGKIFKGTEIFRQKIISQWQDYFVQNANLLAICFSCNDSAQEQFLQQFLRQKQLAAERAAAEATAAKLNYNDDDNVVNLHTQQSAQSNQFIFSEAFSPVKANPFEEYSIKKSSPMIGTNQFSNNNNNNGISNMNGGVANSIAAAAAAQVVAGQGDNYPDINSIIEEDENNEDQSGNETEKLSKFGDNIAHSRRNSCSSSSSSDINRRSNNNNRYRIKQDSDLLNVNLEGNKSYRSMKSMRSHESKTHPLNLMKEDDLENEIEGAISMANSQIKIDAMNRQLLEDNNTSFKVIQAPSQADRNQTGEEDQPPFFEDFDETKQYPCDGPDEQNERRSDFDVQEDDGDDESESDSS